MSDLEGEILKLATAIRELTLEVRRQGRELQSLHRLVESRLDFQVVSEGESSLPAAPDCVASASSVPSPNPYNPPIDPIPGSAAESSQSRAPSGKQASKLISDQERRAIAERVGAFFRRCLAGQHRGSSGREDNPLGSKVYVLVRDCNGRVFSPPLLVPNFSKLRTFVKPQGVISEEAVFCGFPTQWEAALACSSAGFLEPVARDV